MASPGDYGLYIPTNFIWDVHALKDMDVTSPQFKELLVRLYQNLNNMALALNVKDSAYYNTQEFVNGQMWFPNPAYTSSSPVTPAFRNVYRQVINFGALPDTAVKSVPHNIPINASYSFTRIYGAATDPINLLYIPLPYVKVGFDGVQLDVDATNVNISTTTNLYIGYTISYIVLEYIKN